MPLPTLPPSRPANVKSVDLGAALGPAGEQEYFQLLMLLRHTQGIFASLLVRSDFSPALRDALLGRLAHDLAPLPLGVVRVTREENNPVLLLTGAAEALAGPGGALALVGLEDTPGLTAVPGERHARPPALAALNHGREALRRRCPLPLLLWCDPPTYAALREHAPDFFDHFTGLFRFESALPPAERSEIHILSAEPVVPLRADEFSSRAALAFYERQVAALPDPTPERARALLGLAQALWTKPDGPRTAHSEQALALTKEAFSLLSEETDSLEWARARGVLGNILSDLPTGEHAANVSQAIGHYEAASRVYTETDYPQQWAWTQNNLGAVYADPTVGDRTTNLSHSVCHFEATLRVFTEADFPQDWAKTQNNLGAIYAELPTGDHADNVSRAIDYCKAALRVYTEEDFPQEWAMTQNNLGANFVVLHTGDRAVNLRTALVCFEAALRVYTEADFPLNWAETQFNLGSLHGSLAEKTQDVNMWTRAWEHFAAAERGYASIGLSDNAAWAARDRIAVEAAIQQIKDASAQHGEGA